MKKLFALLLAMLMVFSFAACGGNEDPTEPATEAPTEAPTEPSTEAPATPTILVTEMIVILNENADNMKNLSVTPNEDGSVYVEMYGDTVKKANLEASVLQEITTAFENSGLKAFNGQEEFVENQESSCSIFVMYGEEDMVQASFTGTIPEGFANAYAAMESAFTKLLENEPQASETEPAIRGILKDEDKASLDAIVNAMGLEEPASFIIKNIGMNDADLFAYNTSLPSADGISSAVGFSSQMITTAYSLTIVTLAEGTDAEAIASSFEENIDWLKWVCVQPESAAIAIKDNQVLCLLGSGEIFAQTVTAMDAAGWVPVANLENPNLEG